MIEYRPAADSDVPAMAELRAAEWGTADYWQERIRAYMRGEASPQKARAERIVLVALDGERVAGFAAGHLTRRYDCDGELQWMNVGAEWRRSGIAGELLRGIAAWFVAQRATRVCVDVDPENAAGRAFYRKHGAVPLNPHWLVWDDITPLADFDVRCEWGEGGLGAIGADAIVVVVDVFSFGTAVTLAIENGAAVYAWPDAAADAADFARSENAILAADRSRTTFSLSPESLRDLPAGARLVLPSQNGARLVALARGVARAVVVASLRNATAVARWLSAQQAPVAVLPAGERWSDGSIRFALEDWLGAGAVVAALGGRQSAEGQLAAAAFGEARPRLAEILRDCVSGRELTSRGFAGDVDLDVDCDCTSVVPVVAADGWLRNAI